MKRSAVVLLAFLVTGCFAPRWTQPVDITEATEGTAYGERWGVLNDPYATFRERPDFTSTVSGHGRRGDVEKVTKEVILVTGGTRERWYGFEKGWIQENSVTLCSNLLKARSLAAAQSD
jgi:hypothetical protein